MSQLRPAPSPELAPILESVLKDSDPASIAILEAHALAALRRPDLAADLTQRISDISAGPAKHSLLLACANHAIDANRHRLARQAVVELLAVHSYTSAFSGNLAHLAGRFNKHRDHTTAAALFAHAASCNPEASARCSLFIDAAVSHRSNKNFEAAALAALLATDGPPTLATRAWEAAIESVVTLGDLDWAYQLLSQWPPVLSPLRRSWIGVLLAERRGDHLTATALLRGVQELVSDNVDAEIFDALVSKSAALLGADHAKAIAALADTPASKHAVALALLHETRPDEALALLGADDTFTGCALRLAALAALGNHQQLRQLLSHIDKHHRPSAGQRAALLLHAAPLCVSLQPEYESAIRDCCEAGSVEPVIALAHQMCEVCAHPVLLHAAEWLLLSEGTRHADQVIPWIKASAASTPEAPQVLERIHPLLPPHLRPHVELTALEVLASQDAHTAATRAMELARSLALNDPVLAAEARTLALRLRN
jgi:hypothetical protein